ncbi:phenylacetate-CoA oxygenase subunit PaaI [Halobacteriales archaeon QS_3_64_16]|nr:MAG: phenylacetate-CoA oxygenase subunit PaaI [Halobacteriales archaeon QS_3_64_16]
MSTETTGLGTPESLTDAEREAVEAELRPLADGEFVLAERYTEWQVQAPTLESDLAISNIAQDELGHARLWYDLLEDFGYTEADLIWEASPGEFRHPTLVELPFAEGDWADAIVRGYLYDAYESRHLHALEGTSYPRIADRVGKVLAEEDYHTQHARNWLSRLCDDEPGRERVQNALDRLFPYALTLFAETEHEDAIVEMRIRTESLAAMRGEWLEVVVPRLESLGLSVPASEDGEVLVDLPDQVGKDGSHTEHWPELLEEFTRTYRKLELGEPPRLLEDPNEA